MIRATPLILRPSVSVVLPTRDRAGSLERSIRSVLEQSFADLELIVVDDDSSDTTDRVISSITDSRVQYVRLEQRAGAANARNAGLARCTAELVSFQDSDDEWLPERLALHVAHLRAAPAGVAGVYSDGVLIRSDGTRRLLRAPSMVRGRLLDPATRYYQSFMLGTPAATIVRRTAEAIGGFDERMPAFEDLDLFLRLAANWDLAHIERPLTVYHGQGGGISSNFELELAARRRLLLKHRRALLRESPWFIVTEALAIIARRGLSPIVDRHLTPLDRSSQI